MFTSTRSISDLFQLKAVKLGLLLHSAIAIGLCFVPLFNILGFERAFVSGLISGPIAAFISASALLKAGPIARVTLKTIFVECLQLNLLFLIPTICGGLFVEWLQQSCNPQEGILYILLLPGSCALFGCALGLTCARIFRRPKVVFAAISFLFFGLLAAALVRMYQEPQIFAYSMAFGYWPGSLYDENIRITQALLTHRALSVLVALSLVFFVDAIAPLRNSSSRFFTVRMHGFILAIIFAASACFLHDQGEDYGFDLTRASIDQALSRHVNRKHFELRIDASISKQQLAHLVAEHELHYESLTDFFGEHPRTPIRVYVYRGLAQKRFLMGAYQTQIARPWSNEIHIHGFDIPHRVLKHELAHVFAAQFASGLFKVPSSGGIFVNMGIIEGTAVAADWPADQMTVHEWARAMREQKRAPDPRKILYPQGFWAISAARAYTIAGSFLRFLVDEYGVNAFKHLYRSNDFVVAYSKSLDVLVGEWEAFIDAMPAGKQVSQLAEHRFRQPGIFRKICAHETAKRADDAYRAIRAGDFERGIPLIESVQANRPDSAYNFVFLARALAKDLRFGPARAFLEKAKALPNISAQSKSGVVLSLADLAWQTQNSSTARAHYASIDAAKLSKSARRLLQAKIEITKKPKDIQNVLMPYLLQKYSGGEALVRLGDLRQSRPEDGLTHYLYARQLERLGLCEQGLSETKAAVTMGLPSADFYEEATQMRGRMAVCAKQFEAAQAHFQQIVDSSTRAVEKLKAQEWMRRAKIRALLAQSAE